MAAPDYPKRPHLPLTQIKRAPVYLRRVLRLFRENIGDLTALGPYSAIGKSR